MALDLNDTVQPYRYFRDEEANIVRYVDQMPLLISGTNPNGQVVDVPRVPVEVEDVFERIVNSQKPDRMNSWIDTGTGIVVPAKGAYTDGRFKIRRESESLRAVNQDTVLIGRGIPHESYEAIQGAEFLTKDVIVNRGMRKGEARENPALLELLGRDTSFRDAVIEKVFYEGKKQFEYKTMMGIYLPSKLYQAHERAFYVVRLGCGSRLGGRSYLDCDYGRLVGKAPEVPNALERFYAKNK
ncbi:hypothetical protein HY450_00195 [Candidatus Pacearchaeota archaeon]|nr:hypothetical protein [Candidatus Pacearchaeota archaeon]